jgi:hypothetical protein
MNSVIGGNTVYLNLSEIADLFRSLINDTANNTTGSGTGTGSTAGLIMPNSNPDLVTILRSAIRTTYSDLRNIGEPQLIIDNYILSGIPPLAQADPAVQVSLGYMGYFNGFSWSNQWVLPVGVTRVLAMWERATNTGDNFISMTPAPFGLSGTLQGLRMGQWEMREGQIWMRGCLSTVDLRIRARITYPDNLSAANLNFDTTYVPILNCADAIAAKMLVRYAQRFAPEQYAMAKDMEKEEMGKLKLETVRAMQANENQRAEFGAEAVMDFPNGWAQL